MLQTPITVTLEGLLMSVVCAGLGHGLDAVAVRAAVREFAANDHIWRTLEIGAPKLIEAAAEAHHTALIESESKSVKPAQC